MPDGMIVTRIHRSHEGKTIHIAFISNEVRQNRFSFDEHQSTSKFYKIGTLMEPRSLLLQSRNLSSKAESPINISAKSVISKHYLKSCRKKM